MKKQILLIMTFFSCFTYGVDDMGKKNNSFFARYPYAKYCVTGIAVGTLIGFALSNQNNVNPMTSMFIGATGVGAIGLGYGILFSKPSVQITRKSLNSRNE